MENNKYRGKLVSTYIFEGREIKTYENNDPNLDPDIIGVLLSTGRRAPQNEYEKRLLAEIKQMQKDGKSIEFPFN